MNKEALDRVNARTDLAWSPEETPVVAARRRILDAQDAVCEAEHALDRARGELRVAECELRVALAERCRNPAAVRL